MQALVGEVITKQSCIQKTKNPAHTPFFYPTFYFSENLAYTRPQNLSICAASSNNTKTRHLTHDT